MAAIERFERTARLSRAVVYMGTAYLSGITADDKSANTYWQTVQVLAKADDILDGVGSHRSKLLYVQIWLRDVEDFDEMNRAWVEWLGDTEPPARATVGANFALPEIRVEIQFTAAVQTG